MYGWGPFALLFSLGTFGLALFIVLAAPDPAVSVAVLAVVGVAIVAFAAAVS